MIRVAPLAVLGAAVLLLSGCAPVVVPAAAPPSATPTPTAEPVELGDVVTAEQVTDELGTYMRTTIDPESEAYTTLVAEIDPVLYERGWTDDDLLSAQRWVARFVAEQTTDSIALDRPGAFADWLDTVLPSVGNSDHLTGELTHIVANAANTGIPELLRDGGPRIRVNNIAIDSVDNVDYEGRSYVRFAGSTDTAYRADREAIIAYAMARNSATRDETLAAYPDFDVHAERDWGWSLESLFTYTLERHGDSWRLVGYWNNFATDTLIFE